MTIPILFENSRLLIINKPAGLIVHSDGKTDEPTLVDWILEHYPEIKGVGENMLIHHRDQEIELERPGIVHRIDRDTSGILVIVKNQSSFDYIKNLFKERKVEKKYYTLVYGRVKQEQGTIHQPIGRHTSNFRMKMAGNHARGQLRDAVTDYRVIERYRDTSKKNKQQQYEPYTLLECSPKTGRTHQIRAHLKWLNHPIVADEIYSGKRTTTLGLTRMALHAYSISFSDSDGTPIFVTAELPKDIIMAINSLSKEESTL